MKKTITTREFEVPMEALMEVADLLIEHELPHHISATDEENDMITISVEYEKDDREVIHEIEDIIDDYSDEDDDDDEEDEDEEDDRK